MKLAYMRVSTDRQDTRIQEDAIRATKPDRIYKDVDTGTNTARKAYTRLINDIQEGKVFREQDEVNRLIVWKLDRLGRFTFETLHFFYEAYKYPVQSQFVSLMEPGLNGLSNVWTVDREILLIIHAIKAGMEIRDNNQRVRAGIDRAQAAGVHCGRPSKEMIAAGWQPKRR